MISDISGTSGQAIIAAVLKGERDPYKLADLADYRVKASREEVARSLEGNWRAEVLGFSPLQMGETFLEPLH